jgi:hypothetical protein
MPEAHLLSLLSTVLPDITPSELRGPGRQSPATSLLRIRILPRTSPKAGEIFDRRPSSFSKCLSVFPPTYAVRCPSHPPIYDHTPMNHSNTTATPVNETFPFHAGYAPPASNKEGKQAPLWLKRYLTQYEHNQRYPVAS